MQNNCERLLILIMFSYKEFIDLYSDTSQDLLFHSKVLCCSFLNSSLRPFCQQAQNFLTKVGSNQTDRINVSQFTKNTTHYRDNRGGI